MRIQIHPEASAEIAFEHDFYEQRVAGLGAELAEAIDAALSMIAVVPRAWQQWSELDEVRVFHLEPFPFSLPCLVEDDRIVVLALAHAKRRPGYWRERLRGV